MTRLRALEPFGNPRFSLYFTGQVISNTGTWFQNLALSLVVLEVTGSAQSLSAVTVAQFLPLLLLGIPAGRLADRVRPRSILLVTSALSAAVVGALAAVVAIHPDSVGGMLALVLPAGHGEHVRPGCGAGDHLRDRRGRGTVSCGVDQHDRARCGALDRTGSGRRRVLGPRSSCLHAAERGVLHRRLHDVRADSAGTTASAGQRPTDPPESASAAFSGTAPSSLC